MLLSSDINIKYIVITWHSTWKKYKQGVAADAKILRFFLNKTIDLKTFEGNHTTTHNQLLLYYNNFKFLEATMWHHHSVDNLEKFTYILKNKTRRDENELCKFLLKFTFGLYSFYLFLLTKS